GGWWRRGGRRRRWCSRRTPSGRESPCRCAKSASSPPPPRRLAAATSRRPTPRPRRRHGPWTTRRRRCNWRFAAHAKPRRDPSGSRVAAQVLRGGPIPGPRGGTARIMEDGRQVVGGLFVVLVLAVAALAV